MTAPSAITFITPPGLEWTTTLVTVANADVLTFNGEDFTCETSGATGNEFDLVSGNMPATAVNLATALNASTDTNPYFIAYPTGPFSLALATLANTDTLSINGVQFKAVTSGADHVATPREFNLASDHGAADLAAQVNGVYGTVTGVSGLLGATASSTTVTLTGILTAWIPPGTVTHGVMSAASAVVTIRGGLSSYSATIASGSATLRALVRANLAFYANIQITGGSSDDSVSSVQGLCEGVNSSTDVTVVPYALPVVISPSEVQADRPLSVLATADVATPIGMNLYSWQWDGSTQEYNVSAILSFAAAGRITADPANLTIVNPTAEGDTVGSDG